MCGRVFRYAIATGRAQHDVSSPLRDALIRPKVTHRAAITDPIEVGVLLRAIDQFTGHVTTRAGLQLAAHLFVRPGELRHAEWAEIDMRAAVWTIPASKMKMRRPHRVPLSIQALEILSELHGLTGAGQYVFPSFYTSRRPMSENTLNQALRRLGYSGEEMTSHGFRAMASTLLNETGKVASGRDRASARPRRGQRRSPRLCARRTLGRAGPDDAVLVRPVGSDAVGREGAQRGVRRPLGQPFVTSGRPPQAALSWRKRLRCRCRPWPPQRHQMRSVRKA